MHRRESAEPTVAASPQGSLIVILKDNMKSTWQFRQFKAEATQTVRKVEQIHGRGHRHSHTSPSKHSTSRGTANTQQTLTASSLHTSRPCCAQGCTKAHPSVHTPAGCCSLTQAPHTLTSVTARFQHPQLGTVAGLVSLRTPIF